MDVCSLQRQTWGWRVRAASSYHNEFLSQVRRTMQPSTGQEVQFTSKHPKNIEVLKNTVPNMSLDMEAIYHPSTVPSFQCKHEDLNLCIPSCTYNWRFILSFD